ncbi:MAG: transglutaminase family protein [Verrucomicrobia bacterium]|nr:transglutaminase family protein [Verrucomicrobiota bacterium]
MPLYRVTHHTRYRHNSSATAAWQSLHLQPRQEPVQQCEAFELEIRPHPADLAARTDIFGNKHHLFTLREPHTELAITSRSLVQRDEPVLPMPGLTPSLTAARAEVGVVIANGSYFSLEQFLHPSAHVPLPPAARALAEGLDAGDPPAFAWLAALGARFGKLFTFDPKATTVSTPIAEVLQHRRGVCQDFAHLFISCVRQHGLPAAYVSGYLLTTPPPGKPRLRGADASHAWVSVFIPGTGWIDYDPTNNCFVGSGHIVVARGRDFSDVSPVKGLFTGGGRHTLVTAITVEPADAAPVED